MCVLARTCSMMLWMKIDGCMGIRPWKTDDEDRWLHRDQTWSLPAWQKCIVCSSDGKIDHLDLEFDR